MRRHIIAAAVLAPAAALASALPATAAPAHTTTVRTNTVMVKYNGSTAPLHALRSSTQKCAGTLVSATTAKVAGKPVAQLDVYATPANGGTIIACLKHMGATRGVRLNTMVDVAGAPTMTSKKSVLVVAQGVFSSYAGPAAIGGVKGKCFAAAGALQIGKQKVMITTKPVCTK